MIGARTSASNDAPIHEVEAAAYRIPTDGPEADGTFAWDSTTLVVVHLKSGNEAGVGYTYASASVAPLVRELAKTQLVGTNGFDIPGCRLALLRAVRNLGRSGLAACAISAIDAALWDLKAKVLDQPLAALLGRCRDSARIYGSGGFTTY